MSAKIQEKASFKKRDRGILLPATVELPCDIWSIIFLFTHFSSLGALRQASKSLHSAFHSTFLKQSHASARSALQSVFQAQTIARLNATWALWDPTLALWQLLKESGVCLIGESILEHVSPMAVPKALLKFAAPYVSMRRANRLLKGMRQLFRGNLKASSFDHMEECTFGSDVLINYQAEITIVTSDGKRLQMELLLYAPQHYDSMEAFVRDHSIVSLQECIYDGTKVHVSHLADAIHGVGKIADNVAFMRMVKPEPDRAWKLVADYQRLGYLLHSCHGSYLELTNGAAE